MVLALQLDVVYQESILGTDNQKAFAGHRIALVAPTLVSTWSSVLPGFAPAGEALLLRQKDPKPVTPRLASLERTDACLRRADQLASLKQGPPPDTSVPPLGQAADVGPWKTNMSVTHEEGRSYIFCMIQEEMVDSPDKWDGHLTGGEFLI